MNKDKVIKLLGSENEEDVVLGVALANNLYGNSESLAAFLAANKNSNINIDIYSRDTDRNIRLFKGDRCSIYHYSTSPTAYVNKYEI